jgi:hypothetical protein
LVTFVLTDVEGSTPLLRKLGEGYAEVLSAHWALLREVWDIQGGVEFGTTGDGSVVAFPDAGRAVAACVAAQWRLGQAVWAQATGLRVRMGVHSGLAAPNNGTYNALAVHQGARVMAAAHGGQVLVSADAVRAAGAVDGVDLRRLGSFRLRDFDDTVTLFEAQRRDFIAKFPAPKAVPADGHNLIPAGDGFFGRDEPMERLDALVEAGRVTTVVGLGGVGKTRLVTEWGLRTASRWEDGVWFVDLAATDELTVLTAIGATVGAQVGGTVDPWRALVDRLGLARCVVILDNCEHLRAAMREHTIHLLDHCPGLAIVATSRVPLDLGAEFLLRLTPLDAVEVDSPATHLFKARASASGAELRDDPETISTIATICRLLGGLPLPIELAAARTRIMHPAEILAGLRSGDGPTALTQGRPSRHRSLEASLDWSYGLLNEDTRRAYRRLGVFVGSFDLDAAAAALGGYDSDVPPSELVWRLTDSDLLTGDIAASGSRYRYLPPVREDALRRLAGPELSITRRRLAHWYLEHFGPSLPRTVERISRFRDELDNVRWVASSLAETDVETAQTLAVCIARFHKAMGATAAGIAETTAFLADLPLPTPEHVGLLCRLSSAVLDAGDTALATAIARDAATMAESVGFPAWSTVCVDLAMGSAASAEGDNDRAGEIARRAMARNLQPHERADMLYLAAWADAPTDLDRAVAALEEAIAIERARGDDWGVAMNAQFLAAVACGNDDPQRAVHYVDLALDVALRLGNRMISAAILANAAYLVASDDPVTATRLTACAMREVESSGASWSTDDCDLDRIFAARDVLGEFAYEAARASGAVLPLHDGVALARSAVAEFAVRHPDESAGVDLDARARR